MKAPNVEKMLELGMSFINMHEAWPQCAVRMGEGGFTLCGTTACHAGWFAILQGKTRVEGYSFMEAASEMAIFLGCSGKEELKSWFGARPALWGNADADGMFCDSDSFGKEYLQLTLEDIGNHWLQVAERVEAHQEAGA